MGRNAFPYRIPPDAAMVCGPWQLTVDNDGVDVSDAMPDWDYNTDLPLTRTVEIDMDAIRASTGLPDHSAVAVSLVWTASGSNLRAPGFRSVVDGTGKQTVLVEACLKGSDLGGTLSLETVLTLALDEPLAPSYAPRNAGSLLWSDCFEIRLQGDAPQFPIAIVDFSATSYPVEAGWFVEIGQSMDSATMGSLLLLINEANALVCSAFKAASNPGEADMAIISAVYADVARTLLEHALSDEDFDLETEYSDGSVGETLQSLISMRFPNRTLSELRNHRTSQPRLFSTEVQASVGIFSYGTI